LNGRVPRQCFARRSSPARVAGDCAAALRRPQGLWQHRDPLKIVHRLSDLSQPRRRVCLAIGFFDGVHLGHQQIIRQTTSDARQHEALSLIVSFDCHPASVVAPDRAPLLIYPLEQKLQVIRSLGVDTALLIHFDEEFSRLGGEAFIRALAREAGQVRSICVGANFVFGHKRSGNVELLRRLGTEVGFAVHGLAAVALDGKAVSSTRIRQAIAAGNLDAAGQMLGRAYSLVGKVIQGDQLGRQLGFPTANLDVAGLMLPPAGVYAAQARVGDHLHRAVANIGTRPSVQSAQPQLRVEAHLLDFTGDLYHQDLELVLLDKLRDEKKFPSLDALRNQIARDILDAQLRF
jgi:riboflavin kinase / FMN adenylyltransferase